MMDIDSTIEEELAKWKRKGLQPSTLKVGPDIQQSFVKEHGYIPQTYKGLLISTWPDNGLFVTGPWNYTPTK